MHLYCIYVIINVILLFIVQCESVSSRKISLVDEILGACRPVHLARHPSDLNSSQEMKLALLTKASPLTYKRFELQKPTPLLYDEGFNSNYTTIIYIYGHNANPTHALTRIIAEGYSTRGEYNFIVFETKFLEGGNYFKIVNAVPSIAKRLANALKELYSNGFDIKRLELVGHSLGCHIAGFTGRSFHELTHIKLPTIIALEPARPCYTYDYDGMNHTDAEFIQVIHTNADGLGLTGPSGTVDVYVNGGRLQTGYPVDFSHLRVVMYWKNAVIDETGYVANKCDSLEKAFAQDCNTSDLVFMGPKLNKSARGIYHIKIKDN